MKIQTHTAIKGVCAWPNLQQMEDGALLVFIFNQPCHGKWEGDLDCWASEDAGQTWHFRGRPAPHVPTTNRMNCAVGKAGNGDLLVLCSGWSDRLPPGQPVEWREGIVPLTPWICRSSDQGKSWEVTEGFPDQPHGRAYIPFGDILPGQDGNLRAFVYGRSEEDATGTSHLATYVMTSRDDGRTWGETLLLNQGGNETFGLHLGDGTWIAASRERTSEAIVAQSIRQFVSHDDAQTWEAGERLSLPQQVNGHLLKLADGRLALTYTNRCLNNFGVDLRISGDGGASWDAPIRLADNELSDCGYPSTVQLADGSCVTAWYAQLSGEFHYDMRVTTWTP